MRRLQPRRARGRREGVARHQDEVVLWRDAGAAQRTLDLEVKTMTSAARPDHHTHGSRDNKTRHGQSRFLRSRGVLYAATLLLLSSTGAVMYTLPAQAAPVPTCHGQRATIVGTPRDDTIRGT